MTSTLARFGARASSLAISVVSTVLAVLIAVGVAFVQLVPVATAAAVVVFQLAEGEPTWFAILAGALTGAPLHVLVRLFAGLVLKLLRPPGPPAVLISVPGARPPSAPLRHCKDISVRECDTYPTCDACPAVDAYRVREAAGASRMTVEA